MYSKLIKKKRKELGLSQQNFAAHIGFSIQFVRDHEQGRRPRGPTWASIEKLADALEYKSALALHKEATAGE